MRHGLSDGNLDLTPLDPVWDIVCRRYRSERFNPQPGLFLDHAVETQTLWGQFIHWELFPSLLRENEFVRNILRAVGLLPSLAKAGTLSALRNHIEEMNMTSGRPLSDPAEIE